MFQECFSGSLESQVINNVKFFQSLNIIEGDILQLDNDTNAKDTVDEDFLLLIIESGTQKSYEELSNESDEEIMKEIISINQAISGLEDIIKYLLLKRNSLVTQSGLVFLENLKERLIIGSIIENK